MFRVMKSMMAEFSYFIEKHFGVTSILWTIIFMAVCCSVVFITLAVGIEYAVNLRKKNRLNLKEAQLNSQDATDIAGCKSKVYSNVSLSYTLYVVFVSISAYLMNRLVSFSYTWDSKLQRVMSNLTYVLSFKTNRKLFLDVLALPDNVFNQKHLFHIALYLNDNQWNSVLDSLDSEKWYFEKIQKAIYEILHVGDYHLSLGVFYQGFLTYVPILLLAVLVAVLIYKKHIAEGIAVAICTVICLLYNFGACIFVCVALYLGSLIEIWFNKERRSLAWKIINTKPQPEASIQKRNNLIR